jgi:hypothetical protein
VGIESNSFNGFMKTSNIRKREKTTLENFMKLLKAKVSIWQYSMYVIEKYSTTVKSLNAYISE